MPVSSTFLVCQAHVKARLRESPLPLSHLSLSLFSIFSLSSSSPLHISLSLIPSRPLSRCRYNRDGYKRYRRSKGVTMDLSHVRST